MDRVLVIAAHPDDEVLGCGGTIARHADQGDVVDILIIGEGSKSRSDGSDENVRNLRLCSKKAATLLGAKSVAHFGLPDNQLDTVSRLTLIQMLEKHIDLINPDIIYCHDGGDVNIDHRIVNESVVTACRPLPGGRVRKLLSYEVASSTEWGVDGFFRRFQPNLFVDIARFENKKIQALEIYEAELRKWPHPRSIQAVEYQMRLRGAQAGLNAAEAFCILREIERDQ